MKKPWFAIIWFGVWGVFQAFAVGLVLAGRWHRPEVFPEEAYVALIYPDMAFIPLYLLASGLLLMRHPFGVVFALVAGGGVSYALIYLFALSGFRGPTLLGDAMFLLFTLFALWQVVHVGQAGESNATRREKHGLERV
jgi:hypothetical protein